MKMRMLPLLIVAASLVLFTACLNLGTSTSTRFYQLESKPGAIESTGYREDLADTSLGVGPVTIPSYLDRPHLVSRLSGNELRVDEFRQWAEPLKANISRVIEENLSVLTNARHIHSYPKKRSTVVDYQISVDILRFDADTSGSVTLKSVWRIIDPDDKQQLVEKRTTIVQASNSTDTADVVDAMSRALAELSREMVKVLVEVRDNVSDTS